MGALLINEAFIRDALVGAEMVKEFCRFADVRRARASGARGCSGNATERPIRQRAAGRSASGASAGDKTPEASVSAAAPVD